MTLKGFMARSQSKTKGKLLQIRIKVQTHGKSFHKWHQEREIKLQQHQWASIAMLVQVDIMGQVLLLKDHLATNKSITCSLLGCWKTNNETVRQATQSCQKDVQWIKGRTPKNNYSILTKVKLD